MPLFSDTSSKNSRKSTGKTGYNICDLLKTFRIPSSKISELSQVKNPDFIKDKIKSKVAGDILWASKRKKNSSETFKTGNISITSFRIIPYFSAAKNKLEREENEKLNFKSNT